jgi:hypothetical protein
MPEPKIRRWVCNVCKLDTWTKEIFDLHECDGHKPSPVGDELVGIVIDEIMISIGELIPSQQVLNRVGKSITQAIRAYLLEGLPQYRKKSERSKYDEPINENYLLGFNACLKEIKERWGVR